MTIVIPRHRSQNFQVKITVEKLYTEPITMYYLGNEGFTIDD